MYRLGQSAVVQHGMHGGRSLVAGAAVYYCIPFLVAVLAWRSYEGLPGNLLLFVSALVAGAGLAGYVAARFAPDPGPRHVALRAAIMVGIGFAAGGIVAVGAYAFRFVPHMPVEPFTFWYFLFLALPMSLIVAIGVGAIEDKHRRTH